MTKKIVHSSIALLTALGLTLLIVGCGGSAAPMPAMEAYDAPGEYEFVEMEEAADYDEEKATLSLGEEEVELTMDAGSAPAAPAKPTPKTSTRKTFASKFTPVVTRRSSRTSRTSAIKRPPTPKYTGAELKKHLQEYNMEVIRKGMPPLPIPLTQEQDDLLVKEGILPAK